MFRYFDLMILTTAFLINTSARGQDDFRRWLPEEGIAVRQGWHISWNGAQTTRLEGEVSGETAFCWTDARHSTRDVYLQVLDTNGEFKFVENGVQITEGLQFCDISMVTADLDGSWFIACIEFSREADGVIYVLKANTEGEVLWTIEIAEASMYDDYNNLTANDLVADHEGGCYFLWIDHRNDQGGDAYAIHVTAEGNIHDDWPENGLALSNIEGDENQINAAMMAQRA